MGSEDSTPLSNLLHSFLEAGSWEAAQEVLATHPEELLSDEALALLDQEIARQTDGAEQVAELIEERDFFGLARRFGIEAAFRERMIAACERDLQDLSWEPDPETRLGLTLQLATSYSARTLGTQKDNLETARAAYERALEHMPRETMLESWAPTMNNLALLYTRRIEGRHEENVEHAIALYREVLETLSNDVWPELRASVLSNLGKALCESPADGRAALLAEAASRFRQALTIYEEKGLEEDWAETLTNLGTVYLELPTGTAEDRNRAIECFRQALRVLSPGETPAAWARAFINLANAYRERAQQGRPRDLEVAIRLYRRLVKTLPRETLPADWATAQINLAIAWLDRAKGNRADSLERAIEACEQGLSAIDREGAPDLWADLQGLLGTVYDHRVQGLRRENQEKAIAALGRALQIHTRRAYPLNWAASLHNLAGTYRERIAGLRPRNIEAAIRMYRRVFEVYSRETMPRQWAETRADLAAAYMQRVEGDRHDNLEEAMRGYREALEVIDRREQPFAWSNAQVDLGVAHALRAHGDLADNLEEAIEACRQALTIQTREEMPFDWARLQGSLGFLLTRRARGNRAENLEEALAVTLPALEVLTPETAPYEWADVLNNLGLVYLDRRREGRTENVDKAISCFQQALGVRQREAMPLNWGITLSNLGNAWSERPGGDAAANLEEAIAAYEKALEVLIRKVAPLEWAGVKSNLALAYRKRLQGDPAENLERAIVHCKDALEVRTRRSLPLEWARTLGNLGILYFQRIHGQGDDNRRLAEAALREALEVVPEESLPADHRSLQRGLADLYFAEGNWPEAGAAYAGALQAAELLYQSGATPEGRDFELGENRELAQRAAYTLAKQGDFWQALVIIEHWKTRSLTEALARSEGLLGRLPAVRREAFRSTVERIRVLEIEAREAGLPGNRNFPDVAADLRDARHELATIAGEIRKVEPDFLPAGLDAAGIEAVVRAVHRPLAYLVATSRGSLVLLLHAEEGGAARIEVEPLWADAYSQSDVSLLLLGVEEGGEEDQTPVLLDNRERLRTRAARLGKLGEALVKPLADRLRRLDAPGPVLIPSGLLSLVPLHAAPYELEGREVCLLEETDLSLSPSARALGHAAARLAADPVAQSLVAVGNPLPLPKGIRSLELAAVEAAAVARLFGGPSRLLMERQAEHAVVESAIWDAGYLHLACHGRFDPGRPLETGLLLSRGDCLTVRDLLDGHPLAKAEKPVARLVVLSACQSALTEFHRLPDEAIGLPSVFLQAGAPGVIGTLWQVDDLSTTLLMIRFYELHLRGAGEGPLPPARALRQAQLWLRDVKREDLLAFFRDQRARHQAGWAGPTALLDKPAITSGISRFALEEPGAQPFAEPYYWAPFVFMGM